MINFYVYEFEMTRLTLLIERILPLILRKHEFIDLIIMLKYHNYL